MKVLRAEAMGICFGVRDALQATRRIARADEVTIYGELVHNEQLLVELDTRGFRQLPETKRSAVPDTPTVLITAHGISDRAHDRLRASGKRIIDTTCPLVRRVHRAARAFEEGGFQVIVIGRKGHVEVDGIVGDLTKFEVVQTPADVRRYATNRIGIVCQTTERQCRVEAIRAEIRAQNPQAEIRFVDTICQPTRDRQAALERLLNVVDVMVVVGGQHSNNTRQLVIRSRERGVLAHHVQSAADLQPQWFQAARTVGLTAGTSTPDSAIQEVYEALSAIQNEGESP